jgi:hypothetical protein
LLSQVGSRAKGGGVRRERGVPESRQSCDPLSCGCACNQLTMCAW